LVGAGTVQTENYSGALCSPAQRQDRRHRGQAEVPPIAVVTNRGRIDHDARIFTQTEVPPLILTSANAVADANTRVRSVAEAICTRATSDRRKALISNVVSMRRRRLVRSLSTSTVIVSALLAGCAPLLAADPRYATDSGARPQGQPTTEKKAGGPPAIEAPKNDLS